jgi:predicted ArsR family transcriptional regulator
LATPWDHRFFTSTRGQIVALLRRSACTVEELAKALGLTYNGVRVHLAVLGRDGIVQQQGTVRRSSSGKPAYVYELTPEAEKLFSKAYEPMLRGLLEVLSEHVTPEESKELLSRVGRRMAQGRTMAQDGIRAGMEAAVGAFNELGGLAELEERNGDFIIRSNSCPLYAIVVDHPEVCRMMETLLSELMGVPVHEHCDRGERPRCCFEVAVDGGAMRE